jgi:Undecaprenyl-phosphate glucose phosphotransferase
MLRRYHHVWRSAFILVELSISALTFLAAYRIRFLPSVLEVLPAPSIPDITAYYRVVPALALVLWITSSYFRLYQPRRISSLLDELAAIVKANGMAFLLLMTLFFFDRAFSYSRTVVVIFALLNPIVVLLFRLGLRTCLRSLRAHGYNLRRILIFGTGRPAQALIHRLRRNPWTGMRVLGLVSASRQRVGTRIHDVPVLGSLEDDPEELLKRYSADQVYVALPFSRREQIERLVRKLSERVVDIRLVPDVFYFLGQGQNLTDFEGLPVVSVWENHLHGWNAFVKRLLDIVIALVGIIACLPIFLAVGLMVKLTSRGPVLFLQPRMGLDGRIFKILKFRTMHLGAEAREGWTQPDDARCTAFGRLLRRTSLDELPQLFNVLVGQMSLVGPRPERPVLIEKFRKTVPRYMLRHQFKAGITGWAQVNGWRGNTSLRKRIQYDLYYLQNWSIWFDLKILALTLVRGLVHRNAY